MTMTAVATAAATATAATATLLAATATTFSATTQGKGTPSARAAKVAAATAAVGGNCRGETREAVAALPRRPPATTAPRAITLPRTTRRPTPPSCTTPSWPWALGSAARKQSGAQASWRSRRPRGTPRTVRRRTRTPGRGTSSTTRRSPPPSGVPRGTRSCCTTGPSSRGRGGRWRTGYTTSGSRGGPAGRLPPPPLPLSCTCWSTS
mmetsp:Transcript_14477/g.26150  ORF Transcript_14477/g.26150 Transcript_14477/m.26150 type:complete len:207 (+) Transcript_14477:1070-1690(+)